MIAIRKVYNPSTDRITITYLDKKGSYRKKIIKPFKNLRDKLCHLK